MKRVNIFIDSQVHRRAKVLAVLKGVTLNEYLESAIEHALKKEHKMMRMP